jgi:hypothetical protein
MHENADAAVESGWRLAAALDSFPADFKMADDRRESSLHAARARITPHGAERVLLPRLTRTNRCR